MIAGSFYCPSSTLYLTNTPENAIRSWVALIPFIRRGASAFGWRLVPPHQVRLRSTLTVTTAQSSSSSSPPVEGGEAGLRWEVIFPGPVASVNVNGTATAHAQSMDRGSPIVVVVVPVKVGGGPVTVEAAVF